ncbi:sulfate adenylyltransferase subunit 1 [Streptomyces sp. NPDC059224]|uniref:sulfate adenylyltransferase subunit 1 n=1 Tax=Streptomyces sp. NPDC059224 TaxID=3346775 RepID=UPI0036AA76B4
MDLLTFATAGSVDDGKSTLIGRFLHDTRSISTDQLDSVTRTSGRLGLSDPNLALFTDGLRAEREQGITIDVAYRHFATRRRRFILADTPGHAQYTRNMISGVSTADAAVVLVDARQGLTRQTRRHLCLLFLLRVEHILLAVNKMDLAGFAEERFETVRAQTNTFLRQLGTVFGAREPNAPECTAVPVCALLGDNVVRSSDAMPWYPGPPLLRLLEDLPAATADRLLRTRFPVQYVLRPGSDSAGFHDYRGCAGRLISGVLRPGDQVIVMPDGLVTTVSGIDGPHGPLPQALPGISVSLRLADQLDVGRGHLLCDPVHPPAVLHEFDATLFWMETTPGTPGRRLLLKQHGRTVTVVVEQLHHHLDVTTLRHSSVPELGLNDIGRVRLRSAQPVLCDDYRDNRATGSFILIDPDSNRTVAAGTVETGEAA